MRAQTELHCRLSCVSRIYILKLQLPMWGHKCEALIQYVWCFYKRRKRYLGCLYTERRPCEDTEGGHLQAKEGCLERNKPAHTSVLDFEPPELWEDKLLLCKPPGLWHFVMAAWEHNSKARTQYIKQESMLIAAFKNRGKRSPAMSYLLPEIIC